MQLYLRILGYIKPYWPLFALGLLSALPAGSMDGAIAWAAGQGVNLIIEQGRIHFIYYVPLAVLLLALVQGIFGFLELYFIRFVGASAIRDLRNQLFVHLQKQPLLYFQNQSSGVLIGRLINDVAIVENAISQTFQTMISRVITLVSLSVVILYQSWLLALIAISIFSLIVLPVSIVGKRIRKQARSGQEAIGDLVSVLSESIQGTKVVQAFNLEDYQNKRFVETNGNFFNSSIKAAKAEAILSPILAMIGAVGIASVIWVAGSMIAHKQMTFGALTSFVVSLLLLYAPLKNIGRINGVLQPALAAASRIFDVLDHDSDRVESPNAITLQPGPHKVRLENVFFNYPNHTEMVLRDVSLDINPGQMVALIGLSGSGKSTLVNLIPRFFDTTAGTISIDGIPLRDLSLASLRAEIAIVNQDNFLFNTTIGENIRLGKLDATQQEIEEAAKAAYCHDFIMTLPDKYDTQIGERGTKLSGGQQQRLSIARAFLKNAPILILDEATSALDNESEAMVQEALNNLMNGRTVLVIAHRLSTVRHADMIVVMDKGQIIETGSHDVLLAKDAGYARLLNAQFHRPTA